MSRKKSSAAPAALPDLAALLVKIENLSPPDKLRLAADLMDARRGDIAQPIIAQIAEGLAVAMRYQDRAHADREATRGEGGPT